MAKKRVRLINTIVRGRPGKKFAAFGHQFEIQPDGSAVALVDEAFVESEVKAGRYVLVEDQFEENEPELDPVIDGPDRIIRNKKDAPSEVIVENPLEGFSNDLNNYFGAGSIDELRKKIKALNKNKMQLFAEKRLQFILPDSMGKARMVTEIVKTIEALIKAKMPDEGGS